MKAMGPEEACFFTQQVYLIGTEDEDTSPRFAPISWVSYSWGSPACLVISIYGTKQTKKNIARTKQLTAAVVTEDMLPFIEQCNRQTYRKEAMESFHVDIIQAETVQAPMLADGKFTYECEVINQVELGETTTYFAKINKICASDEILALDFLDLRKIKPVIYSPENYFLPGEHLGKIGDFSKL